jgi:hypothetical protein
LELLEAFKKNFNFKDRRGDGRRFLPGRDTGIRPLEFKLAASMSELPLDLSRVGFGGLNHFDGVLTAHEALGVCVGVFASPTGR